MMPTRGGGRGRVVPGFAAKGLLAGTGGLANKQLRMPIRIGNSLRQTGERVCYRIT
jgi:hypothetical protein